MTFHAFVYDFGDIEEDNIIGPFTLGTGWQESHELGFITINSNLW